MKKLIAVIAGVVFATLLTAAAYAGEQFSTDNIASNRFVFTDQTVKDKRTGLTWTREANFGIRDWQGSVALVKSLNAKKYAGFNDWRIPSAEEMGTLQAYAKGVGCDTSSVGNLYYGLTHVHLNRIGFYDVQGDYYWSSNNHFDNTSSTKGIHMYYSYGGYDGEFDTKKKDKIYVWPVRGDSLTAY